MIGADRIFWVHRTQLLSYRPAMKRVVSKYMRNGVYNYIPDGEFGLEAWDEHGRLRAWEGSAQYEQRESDNEGGFDLYLPGKSSTFNYATVLRSAPFFLDRRAFFSTRYKIHCEEDITETKTNPAFYVEIKCGDYYYKNDFPNATFGEWTTTQTFNNLVTVGQFRLKFDEYLFFSLHEMPAPPVPALCTVRFTQAVSSDYLVTGLSIDRMHIAQSQFLESLKRFYVPFEKIEVNPKHYTEEHIAELHIGGPYQYVGDPAETGEGSERISNTISVSGVHHGLLWDGEWFQVKHAQDRYHNLHKPRQLLNGTLRGVLNFGDLLSDTSNPSKSFLCLGYTNNDKDCTYEGEWLEIGIGEESFLIDYQANYAVDYEDNKVTDYSF